MRVDFPDGQWAEIYTVGEMPRRITVRLQEMLAEIPDDQNGYAYGRDMGRIRDTLLAMVVKQWSYDGQAPGDTADDVYDLPQDSYDKLREETREHWKKAGFFEAATTEMEETPTATTEKKPEPSTSSA